MANPAHVILISPHGELETYRVTNEVLSDVWALLQKVGEAEEKLGKPSDDQGNPGKPVAAVIPAIPEEPVCDDTIRELPELTPNAAEVESIVAHAVESKPEPVAKPELAAKPEPVNGDAAFMASLMSLMGSKA